MGLAPHVELFYKNPASRPYLVAPPADPLLDNPLPRTEWPEKENQIVLYFSVFFFLFDPSLSLCAKVLRLWSIWASNKYTCEYVIYLPQSRISLSTQTLCTVNQDLARNKEQIHSKYRRNCCSTIVPKNGLSPRTPWSITEKQYSTCITKNRTKNKTMHPREGGSKRSLSITDPKHIRPVGIWKSYILGARRLVLQFKTGEISKLHFFGWMAGWSWP